MRKVKIKIPVDYEYQSELKRNVLQYEMVEVDEDSLDKYEGYQHVIEKIFSESDPHSIARKIRNLIEKAYYNSEIVEFFNSNQWLLRFAYSSDVANITDEEKFHTINVVVNFPKGCYVGPEVRKVFTKKISVPIWRQKSALKTKNYIEWLILDDKNTLAEKIESSLLSNYKGTRELLFNNTWLLMQIENKRRVMIMRKLNMQFFNVYMIKGVEQVNGSMRYICEDSAVPSELEMEYEERNKEIKKLLESNEGTLDKRILDYYYSNIGYTPDEDTNELLRDNLWLLNFVSTSTKERILGGLDLLETRKTVKFRTVEKRLIEGDIHSCTMNIDPADLDYYEQLNKQLLTLIFRKKEQFDEAEIADFIKSDETVLKIWPWLIDYVTDPAYIVDILETFNKEKKR